ncbi:MAG: regulatory iron-sulfur-containing complex subunit RicT [Pirellulaceae bacterium]
MTAASVSDDARATGYKFVVRCGAMRTLHVATTKSKFAYSEKVVVRTSRGVETGEVLIEATQQALKHLHDPPGGQILRSLSRDDQSNLQCLMKQSRDDFECCLKHIERLGLQMKLVDIERLFGGERIVVYYLAEKRVDFRQLVRDLTSELKTRIEMKQIGVRDEAKLLADYGDCGKPVCCNTHLSEMPPVSMRMAKLQKATLDPSKISGRCGRLKCCLRYEFDAYEEMQAELPPLGTEVLTRDGKATVLHQEILAQQLLVQTEDNRRVLIDVSEVLSVVKKGSSNDNRTSSDGSSGAKSSNVNKPSKTEGDEIP